MKLLVVSMRMLAEERAVLLVTRTDEDKHLSVEGFRDLRQVLCCCNIGRRLPAVGTFWPCGKENLESDTISENLRN